MQLEQQYYDAVVKLIDLPFTTIPFFGPTVVLSAVAGFLLWLAGGNSGADTDDE